MDYLPHYLLKLIKLKVDACTSGGVQLESQAVPVEGLCMPDPVTGFARVPEQVPNLLGCALGLVDVLACGPEYVAYSVFDCEGETNQAAMAAVAAVSGVAFDSDDEDAILCGAVLVVQC